MADGKSHDYLKRESPVAQLAESRAMRQAQWAISATILAVTVVLAVLGDPVAQDTFLYKLLDELVFVIWIALLVGLAIGLYARGVGRSTKLPARWGPLLLSIAAANTWLAVADDAFVPPVNSRALLVYAVTVGITLAGTCTILGAIYLIGRMLRPGEKKEIN
jgi:hypothetical protein